jgi:hypothetical protein
MPQQGFFRSAFSIVSWPIRRFSSAMWGSSLIAVAMPGKGPLGVALVFLLPALAQELPVYVASAHRRDSQQD